MYYLFVQSFILYFIEATKTIILLQRII